MDLKVTVDNIRNTIFTCSIQGETHQCKVLNIFLDTNSAKIKLLTPIKVIEEQKIPYSGLNYDDCSSLDNSPGSFIKVEVEKDIFFVNL